MSTEYNGDFWFWIVLAIILVSVFGYSHYHNQHARTAAAATQSKCSPDYTPCIPNVSYDLDCSDIRERVHVIGTDVYHLDADHDGTGCERY